MNARFWTFYNDGWIKITLKPGQSLSYGHFGRDEEGSHYQSSGLHFDGQNVTEEWANGGSDCDGRIDRSGTQTCPLHKLHSVPAYGESDFFQGKLIHRPDWQELKPNRIRDQYAEIDNY